MAIDDDDYGLRLLRSHAADVGDPLMTDRACHAAVRLIQLCIPEPG